MFKISLSFDSRKAKAKIEKEAVKQIQAEILPQMAQALAAVTPVDTGEASAGWTVVETPDGGELVNPVEHVKYLNAGTSKQAPSHFIEQTVLSFGKPKGVIVEYKD